MPLPLRRKRRSFGGKDGVWFRRKTLTEEDHEKEFLGEDRTKGNIQSQDCDLSSSVKDGVAVEWDEALARPVYRRPGNSDTNITQDNPTLANFNSNHISSSSSDDSEEENEEAKPRDRLFQSKLIISTARRARKGPSTKRSRTFGGRSRRPLSLLLYHDSIPSSPTALFRSSPSITSTNDKSDLITSLDAVQSPESHSIPIANTSGEEKANNLPSINPGSRPSTSQSPSPASCATPNEKRRLDSGEDKVFDFLGSSQESSVAQCVAQRPTQQEKALTPRRPTPTSSLEEAQRYFAHLDASQPLHLDASESPAHDQNGRRKRRNPSRRLIRTSRKIQLSSPGFVQEYSRYAKASKESGFSPLTTADYARSRREFFRRAELFDGFVDS